MSDQGPAKTADATTTEAAPPSSPIAADAPAPMPTSAADVVERHGRRRFVDDDSCSLNERVAKRKATPAEAEKTPKGKKKLDRSAGPTLRGVDHRRSPDDHDGEPASGHVSATGSGDIGGHATAMDFDLTTFMASFQPGLASEPKPAAEARRVAAPAAPWSSVQDEMQRLREELEALRGQVAGVRLSLSVPTGPNGQGELPADSVRQLTSSSFPEQSKKAKGNYHPPQAHVLAATRIFKDLVPSEGLTILHFREESEQAALEAGPPNGNFASDFSPSVVLLTAATSCDSYDDILDGIHGLARVGEAIWHNYMLVLTERLRVFESKNKSADPGCLHARVKLVLLFVNKWHGAALRHIQVDNPA
ncbi:hypothetical protein PR002_g1897 [Phytophthora rubi]|uniref:Uncharacterized protein n=1 Tax=Phytophthora rubi TaxID=129364 RepID=A0A6A3NX21_9STRA|nr:hypothetical protein PR002_g1897 [Phytophthora rubi]